MDINETREESADTRKIQLSEQHNMKKKIEKLSKIHCIELFEIIKKNTDKYTINKNGVFLNFKNLSNKTLIEIHDFLAYIDSVNKTLNEDRF